MFKRCDYCQSWFRGDGRKKVEYCDECECLKNAEKYNKEIYAQAQQELLEKVREWAKVMLKDYEADSMGTDADYAKMALLQRLLTFLKELDKGETENE